MSAQGGFVLFGDSGVEVAPEQKAVRPISAPYFHEDAFIMTDVCAWYLEHDFDSETAGVLNEGSVMAAALQVRVAFNFSLFGHHWTLSAVY